MLNVRTLWFGKSSAVSVGYLSRTLARGGDRSIGRANGPQPWGCKEMETSFVPLSSPTALITACAQASKLFDKIRDLCSITTSQDVMVTNSTSRKRQYMTIRLIAMLRKRQYISVICVR